MTTRKILGVFMLMSLLPPLKLSAQDFEWIVPDKFDRMSNPVELTDEVLKNGRSLYNKHCKSCHGKKGLGDGPKANEVVGDLGDFSSEKFQSQSDGALFWKSYDGRDFMPGYWKEIPQETDMWSIVHYMRSMRVPQIN